MINIKKTDWVNYFSTIRPIVCVQGLGFVGAAMALATACAEDKNGNKKYNVIGIDLPYNQERIDSLNKGVFPFESTDKKLREAAITAKKNGNFYATYDIEAYSQADIVLIDINLDLIDGKLNLEPFKRAIEEVASNVKEKTLILVETTVPPGTCRHVIKPIFEKAFTKRGFSAKNALIAHSYERVMPGEKYWDSIVNFHRVYSGLNQEAANRCEEFLSDVINTDDYPLTRLDTVEASEMAKVMENSYRAVNIAFIEEWSRMAECVGVDLFSVIDAIRKRPTHSNMMQPGFGVGGYCLTKDPLFAGIAAAELFALDEIKFPFSTMAVKTNNKMPLVSLDAIDKYLGGMGDKHILLLGVSYRQDVADTRYSPSEIFVREAEKRGAIVKCHDPLVTHWAEINRELPDLIPNPEGFDCIVFAVQHKQYSQIDLDIWLENADPYIFDANRVLNQKQINSLIRMKKRFGSIGRG